MDERKRGPLNILLISGALVMTALLAFGAAAPETPSVLGQSEYFIHMPLSFRGAERTDLFKPPPISLPSATPVPTERLVTDTPTVTATFPPTATENPTPTSTPAGDGMIAGRLLVDKEPAWEGLGIDFGPGLFLQVCEASECTVVDKTGVVGDNGRYEFHNPPVLLPGQAYTVLWKNVELDGLFGTPDYIGRWESQPIETYAAGEVVDVPDIELSNIELIFPENDIHYTLPVEYKWKVRSAAPRENYVWALYRNCLEWDRQAEGDFYRSRRLGHRNTHNVNSPPPGYRILDKYCWYVYVEDDERGTGWSFFRYKTMWLGFFELMDGWRP